MTTTDQLEVETYRRYQAEEARYEAIEGRAGFNHWFKYLLSAYNYYRSRLLVPGRSYEDGDNGAIAIGGAAHCDLMDLEVWLGAQPAAARREAIDWAMDTSLEQVAYWRGMGRSSASTIMRRRNRLVEAAAKAAASVS